MTKEEQKRDRYYQREYGIALADYDRMLAEQKECCAICGKHESEFKRRLHVDHDHAWRKVEIQTGRNLSASENDHGWYARAIYRGRFFRSDRMKKSEVKKDIRDKLKQASVRGLLCWIDNTAIQKFRDNPERMEAAAQYLRRFNAN